MTSLVSSRGPVNNFGSARRLYGRTIKNRNIKRASDSSDEIKRKINIELLKLEVKKSIDSDVERVKFDYEINQNGVIDKSIELLNSLLQEIIGSGEVYNEDVYRRFNEHVSFCMFLFVVASDSKIYEGMGFDAEDFNEYISEAYPMAGGVKPPGKKKEAVKRVGKNTAKVAGWTIKQIIKMFFLFLTFVAVAWKVTDTVVEVGKSNEYNLDQVRHLIDFGSKFLGDNVSFDKSQYQHILEYQSNRDLTASDYELIKSLSIAVKDATENNLVALKQEPPVCGTTDVVCSEDDLGRYLINFKDIVSREVNSLLDASVVPCSTGVVGSVCVNFNGVEVPVNHPNAVEVLRQYELSQYSENVVVGGINVGEVRGKIEALAQDIAGVLTGNVQGLFKRFRNEGEVTPAEVRRILGPDNVKFVNFAKELYERDPVIAMLYRKAMEDMLTGVDKKTGYYNLKLLQQVLSVKGYAYQKLLLSGLQLAANVGTVTKASFEQYLYHFLSIGNASSKTSVGIFWVEVFSEQFLRFINTPEERDEYLMLPSPDDVEQDMSPVDFLRLPPPPPPNGGYKKYTKKHVKKHARKHTKKHVKKHSKKHTKKRVKKYAKRV